MEMSASDPVQVPRLHATRYSVADCGVITFGLQGRFRSSVT